jgi:hypothetical protein
LNFNEDAPQLPIWEWFGRTALSHDGDGPAMPLTEERMKARVIITDDGQVQLFIEEGTFEEGKKKIQDFLAWLEAEGLALESRSDVEQHRHDDERFSNRNSRRETN